MKEKLQFPQAVRRIFLRTVSTCNACNGSGAATGDVCSKQESLLYSYQPSAELCYDLQIRQERKIYDSGQGDGLFGWCEQCDADRNISPVSPNTAGMR